MRFKRIIQFLGHVVSKYGVKNLTLTGHIENKIAKAKQEVTYLTNFDSLKRTNENGNGQMLLT